jgi:hypothetical protein
MRCKLMAAILTIGFAFLVSPAIAVTPEDQSTAISSSSAKSALDAIFVPEISGSPAVLLLLVPPSPYSGFCSQDCKSCYYPGVGSPSSYCPPDPVTGYAQVCMRTRSC